LEDKFGWSKEQYYNTIQTAVVDKTLYLLARAASGMLTWRLTGNDWVQVNTTNPPWRSPKWDDRSNYSTIQTAVSENTLYLVGMPGDRLVETWKFDGDDWTQVAYGGDIEYSNAYKYASNYSTFQVAEAGRTLYLIIRRSSGIQTKEWAVGSLTWENLPDGGPKWRSAYGWTAKKYYSTIKLITVGNGLFLLGRAGGGIHTYYCPVGSYSEVSGKWQLVQQDTPPWSDARDWGNEIYYSTIRVASHSNSLYLIARARSIHTWRLSNSSPQKKRGLEANEFNNRHGETIPANGRSSNNRTIQLVSTERFVFAGASGLRIACTGSPQ
jgi:hypothetical protein